tara:strand:- start:2772 stop:3161 length:390 start_codon:yes stop_codon:yes gene_type:complete
MGKSLEEVSLFDLGRGLIATLILESVPVPNENRDWHEFFYELKKEEKDGKPKFFDNLGFDWDGPYPKSLYLSEFFQALNIIYLARSPDGRIVIDEQTINHWSQEIEEGSPELKHYLAYATGKARTHFSN